ncbi:MAG: aminoglycoside phosphotransferase family protein, partial [Nitrospirota bacterium]|nr:aminoglycoside phosphotransferase family protein [Nitrospirota bacterium]
HDIMPRLDSLMLLQKPMTNNSIEYTKGIMEIIEVSGLSRRESTVREFNKIQSFLDSVLRRLRAEGNCDVQLVFTHGDFCPANMLNTRHGIRIIDWEGAKYRSALFDFYSYFFYRPVSRKVPVATLASELNEALPFFISNLDKKAPHISNNLIQLNNVYRWIYYIEQICKEVEREMTDKNLNILESILRYIEAFNRYEEIRADNIE